jgi:signal transduction histidine kinase
VTDTGIGIELRDIDKIFNQFSRLDNAMSQQVGGTGIGLYLAKNLVELHGGAIQVESVPGKGSTFTITLPIGSERRFNPMRNLTVRKQS